MKGQKERMEEGGHWVWGQRERCWEVRHWAGVQGGIYWIDRSFSLRQTWPRGFAGHCNPNAAGQISMGQRGARLSLTLPPK